VSRVTLAGGPDPRASPAGVPGAGGPRRPQASVENGGPAPASGDPHRPPGPVAKPLRGGAA